MALACWAIGKTSLHEDFLSSAEIAVEEERSIFSAWSYLQVEKQEFLGPFVNEAAPAKRKWKTGSVDSRFAFVGSLAASTKNAISLQLREKSATAEVVALWPPKPGTGKVAQQPLSSRSWARGRSPSRGPPHWWLCQMVTGGRRTHPAPGLRQSPFCGYCLAVPRDLPPPGRGRTGGKSGLLPAPTPVAGANRFR